MGLRDIGATLPPGFRFYPSDEELVCHYLYKKIANQEALRGTLVEIDLHTCEPWQLPGMYTFTIRLVFLSSYFVRKRSWVREIESSTFEKTRDLTSVNRVETSP